MGESWSMLNCQREPSMITKSLYANADVELLRPLTDAPCPHAPQRGVHVYHFPLSLCSQKVRQALDEKGLPWRSHIVQLPLYEQYDPYYVRMNPRCVVPTLVVDGRVTTDSENIIRQVDRSFEGPQLVPEGAAERAAMERFLGLADGLFMEVLTYGEIPGARKPLLIRRGGKNSHQHKLELLAARILEHGDEPALLRAYTKKRELVAQTIAAMGSEAGIDAVVQDTEETVAVLAAQLSEGPFADGGWLCGDAFSLADLEWGVVLFRLRWIGLGPRLWGERPAVARYAERLFARPGFRTGVLRWSRPLRDVLAPLLFRRLGRLVGRG